MRNKFLVYFCVLILITVSVVFALAQDSDNQEGSQETETEVTASTGTDGQEGSQETETKMTASTCLACHGSFDDLAKATADYTAPSGETTTPHRYIPHDDPEGIPECTECHKPHEIPLEDASTVEKPANVDFCYNYCHHVRTLQPCSACH